MKIGAAFPSNYIKATDLGGREWKLTMSNVQMEDLNGEEKPVLYFHGSDKGLVLNRTNAEMIVTMYGDETNDWSGKQVTIKPDKTQFGGRVVDCIRVVWQQHNNQAASNGQSPFTANAGAAGQPLQSPSEIAAQNMAAQQGGQAMQSEDPAAGLDDDIPF
jgi:hypothetical protein